MKRVAVSLALFLAVEANAATIMALGTPYQVPGDATGWHVPLNISGFTGNDVQGQTSRYVLTGITATSVTPGPYLSDAVAFHYMLGDTLVVDVVKSSGTCAPTGESGTIATIRFVGSGSAYNTAGSLRDCNNAVLGADWNAVPVVIPPSQPTPARRSTWSHLKSMWR